MSEDFSTADAKVICRRARYTVHWCVPGASYSQGVPDLSAARSGFEQLRRSASVTHVSLYDGDDILSQHDYDPYRWHDVRLMIGR
jgi:hypothetical protein